MDESLDDISASLEAALAAYVGEEDEREERERIGQGSHGARDNAEPGSRVRIGVQAENIRARDVNVDMSSKTYNIWKNGVEGKLMKVGKIGPIKETKTHHLKRSDILGKVSEHLKSSERGPAIRDAVVLRGMPGVGKTVCAAHYIEVHGGDYDNIVWIPAESESSMTNWFLVFAERVLVNSREGQGRSMRNIVDEVYSKLCSGNQRTLVVFDNAECYLSQGESKGPDGNGIEPFFPKAVHPPLTHPHVLITSRADGWSLHTLRVCPVSVFKGEECKEVITSRLGSILEGDTHWEKLANYFGYLPAALDAAISAILYEANLYPEKRRTIMDRFLEILEEQSRSDALEITDNVYQKLHKLYKVVFERVEEEEVGCRALELLDIMALLSPSGVPTELLHKLITKEGNTPSRNDRKAIQLLHSYSLIESNGPYLLTNKVLQDLRWQILMQSDKCSEFLEEFISCYAATLKATILYANEDYDGCIDNAFWVSKKLLKFLHLNSVKSILSEIAHHLRGFNWRETLRLRSALWDQLCREGREGTEEGLKLRNDIGAAFLIGGEYSEALSNFSLIFPDAVSLLGEAHKITLQVKENIGKTYLRQGKYKEASEIFQQVYVIRMEEKRGGRSARSGQRGVEDGESRSTRLNEAIAEKKSGAEEAAYKIVGELYRESIERKGESDAETLEFKAHVGDLLRRKGSNREAITMYKDVETQLVPLYGKDDPRVLRVRHGLALALTLESEHKKAFDILSEICDARVRSLGEEHPDVLKCRYNMGVILNKVGFYSAAANTFRENFEKREIVIQAQHPSSQHSKEGLELSEGNILKCRNQVRIFECMRKSLLNFFGFSKNKNLSLLSDYGLAFCYRALGRYDEALALYKNVLEALYGRFGGEQWDVCVLLRDLEESSILQDDFPDTKEICERMYGEAYEKLGWSTYASIFKMRSKMFKHEDFETFGEKYEEIYKELVGVDDPDGAARETCREEYVEISRTGSLSLFKKLYLNESFFTGIGISSDDIEVL